MKDNRCVFKAWAELCKQLKRQNLSRCYLENWSSNHTSHWSRFPTKLGEGIQNAYNLLKILKLALG